jgi:sulfur carrier protein
VKTVTINGQPREIAASTAASLVDELGLPAPTVLVELNGTALHRSEWPTEAITEGDVIEILRVSAGG